MDSQSLIKHACRMSARCTCMHLSRDAEGLQASRESGRTLRLSRVNPATN